MKKIRGIFSVILCIAMILSQAPMVSRAADAADWQEDEQGLGEMVEDRPILALIYLCDAYDIKDSVGYDGDTVVTVPSGATVEIRDILTDGSGDVWAYVKTGYGDGEKYGYVRRDFLASSDERLLEWEEARNIDITNGMIYASRFADVAAFPESYRQALEELKQAHPNWTFVRMDVGLDWKTVIANEMLGGRSLVHKSLPDYTKAGAYDEGDWYYATEDILKYYMDPRNGLTEDRIFQFELLTYNASYHTEAAVEKFLNNTFMNNVNLAPGTDTTYAHIFWTVGSDEKTLVSPFHLASRVYQEQGQGTSPLISGNYPGYEGYYNYFNIKASGTTREEVWRNGLAHARDQGWSDAFKSIQGGANVIAENYIRKGQDTLYLQKYNVNRDGYYQLYTHQYMQNISAPTTEASTVKKQYAGVGSLENTFVFKIPVYDNMPGAACAYPTTDSGKNGLCLGADGIWHYFSDGVVQTDYTGLAENGQGWWYVKNGSVDFGCTGLCYDARYGWWLVEGGKVSFGYTGLYYDANYGWWLIEGGKVSSGYTGLYNDASCGWWLVEGGRVSFGYTGLYNDAQYGWWLVEGGSVSFGYTGLYNDANCGWWLVEGGSVAFGYTGLYNDANCGWWLVEGGNVAFGYTGLYEDAVYGQWYVQGGQVAFGYTGTAEYGGVTYQVADGQVTGKVSGLRQAEKDGNWYYYEDGIVAAAFTGFYNDAACGWWLVEGGSVAFGYTGLYEDAACGWWLVEEGSVAFGYTGIYEDAVHGSWYVQGGQVAFGYTDTVESDGVTYQVVNGQVISSGSSNPAEPSDHFTGLRQAETDGNWYYYVDGTVDTSFTGLYEDAVCGWWLVEEGSVAFGYVGLYEDAAYGWWLVEGGSVAFGYAGIYEDDVYGSWYVQGGQVAFGYTGPVEHGGVVYQVESGRVVGAA